MVEEAPAGITFRRDLNAWWPDYDHNPVKCKAFVDQGLPAIAAALKWTGRRRECVQAGGHAGFWPLELARHFERVHTFEPEPLLHECLLRNCRAPNVIPYRDGLGATAGTVRFRSHVSAGSWRVDPAGDREISITSIDALELGNCDALFLDIEGYEVAALDGAKETVDRCRPVILAELLPRSHQEIERWLAGMRYKLVDRFGRDGIFTFRGARC